MSHSKPKIIEVKNQWLKQHIDVQYPTKESVTGQKVYFKRYLESQVTILEMGNASNIVDEIYLVDFHRLTVMFALIQSELWSSESDRALVLEFLSQVIFSQPCSLYLGFVDQQPVCAAIATEHEQELLISDVAFKGKVESETASHFAMQLLDYLASNESKHFEKVWFEC